MPPALYTKKTEVTISDRTLVSVGPAHPISGSVMTLASVFDQTLGHFMTGRWLATSGVANVAAHKKDRE